MMTVIITSSGWIPKNELNKVHRFVLELNKSGFPYKMFIEDDYIYHIPNLNKKILGT